MTNFTKIFFLNMFYWFLIPIGTAAEVSENNVQRSHYKKICDLPENITDFRTYIEAKFGNEIGLDDIDQLKEYFDEKVDKMTSDPFYSKTKKVRLIGLEKNCTASDGVPYKLFINSTFDMDGTPVFSQLYLIYQHETILNGERPFSFDKIFGGSKDYKKIISKHTVGLMNKVQIDEFMQSINCTKLAPLSSDSSVIRYFYHVDAKNDLASRLAVWDFSQEILVYFNDDGIVNKINVLNKNKIKE